MQQAKTRDAGVAARELFDMISSFVEDWSMASGDDDFGEFEQHLMSRMHGLTKAFLRRAIESRNENRCAVEIDGERHRRALQSELTVTTLAGPVKVRHTLYRRCGVPATRTLSVLSSRLGLIEGFTPMAAKVALLAVTELVPEKAAELLGQMSGMSPSKSTLDRLPKKLSARWEAEREDLEKALLDGVQIPPTAAGVAISLDGVMGPMKGGARAQKRRETAARGEVPRGPAGYREFGVGTVTFCDELGASISSVRMARRPEENKATLKGMLRATVHNVLARDPTLKVVKIADGSEDNWTFLSALCPDGIEVLDYWHAAQHLHSALADVYGDGAVKTMKRFERLRFALKEETDGVEIVIRALAYLARKHPKSEHVRKTLAYFRKNRRRMKYKDVVGQGLPIGSGVVEAACKTLVTQRLKRSGMAWSEEGAQAILTPRAWAQSKMFDEAWALLAAKYKLDVQVFSPVEEDDDSLPDNVIPFPSGRN